MFIIISSDSKFKLDGGYVIYNVDGQNYKEELIPASLLNSKLDFKYLNPLQTVFYKFYNSGSALIATPTSSGKTVCALHFIQSHKGFKVYTTPTKALANEVYKFFKKVFPNVDLRTGDVIEEAYEIKSDIVVCTYESLVLSLRNKGWGYYADAVVVDEIHFVFTNRGTIIEEVVAFMKDRVDILGLSATLPKYKDIAEWINAKLVIKSNFRPVPIFKTDEDLKI
ncbi:MAG: DEAD/DEAH box helicase [candidate division WOR-3 bacterium]